MHGWLAVVATAASTMLVTSASAVCMKPEVRQIAEGRLTIGKFKDAADRPETAFILRLPAPKCLDGTDADERVDSTARSTAIRPMVPCRRLCGVSPAKPCWSAADRSRITRRIITRRS
jgi:hypothetical protein